MNKKEEKKKDDAGEAKEAQERFTGYCGLVLIESKEKDNK